MNWRKASRSAYSGSCVEAASWRVPRGCEGGACVEAGHGTGVVGVRDSALERIRPGSSPVLEFTPGAWTALIRRILAVSEDRR